MMGVLDYFKPVSTWPPDRVQQFLDQKGPQEYNLVDVRTPKEYEQEHLPGARLIPVAKLETRWKELDRTKPTITY
jgi:rhodanese-related sulfurtransferase